MKRYIYIIVGAIALVIIVGVAFWLLSRARSTPGITGATGTLPGVGLNNGAGGSGVVNGGGTGINGNTGGTGSLGGGALAVSLLKSFGVVSNDPTLDYFVDSQNNVTVIEPNGTIEQVANGQTTVISSTTISNIVGTDFSYNGKKIVISSGDPKNPQTSVFDIASRSWSALPQGMLSVRWAPGDTRVAYFTASSGTVSLAVLDASTTKKAPTTLITLNADDLLLKWINGTQLLVSDRPSAYSAGSVWIFNLVQKTLSPVISDTAGVEAIWSGSASTSAPLGLIFTSGGSGGAGGTLQLDDLSGNVSQTFKFITLPSKCAFNTEVMAASSTAATGTATTTATSTKKLAPTPKAPPTYLALYCGVPRDQNALSYGRLPDDYNQMALLTSDNFFRIDLSTGAIGTIWNDQTQNIDASNVKFFNNTFFFVNRYNQKLYGMILNPPTQGD